MNIHILYQNNPLHNFNYLLECPVTKFAVIIDPFNAELALQFARDKQLTITTIINTHEHWDHTQGNQKIVAATGAEVIAHWDTNIAEVTKRVKAGDIIEVGKTIKLKVLDTPGHTFTHICLFNMEENHPALFCGDTLFNAGCGNIKSGNVDLLFKTFTEQLYLLPDNTSVYPGHDYIINNLRFALTREPNNAEITKLLKSTEDYDPRQPIVTTIAIEKQINPFFRLSSPEIIATLRKDFPILSTSPTPYEVFVCLRELRNRW